MIYDNIGKYVSLSQGLAINSASAHLVSDVKNEVYSYKLLKIADMMSNKYTKYISKEVNKNVIADKKDIIYSRTGQIGIAFRGFSGVVHNNCFIVKLKTDKLDEDYLYCVLKSDFVRNQALSLAKSSVQPDLTHKMFNTITIPIPSLEDQKIIAKKLLNIENKIDINYSIINNLENIVELLFNKWFLQLDYPNKETADAYNSKLDRNLPIDWKVEKLSSISKISAGGDKPKVVSQIKNNDTKIPIYSNGEEKMGLYGYTNKALKPAESITVSARGNIGYAKIRKEAFVPIIRLITIIPKKEIYTEYIHKYISKYNFSKNGSIQQQLTVPNISDIDFPIPPEEILILFHNSTKKLYDKIASLENEITKLNEYKTMIFPLIIIGQIKIKEVA